MHIVKFTLLSVQYSIRNFNKFIQLCNHHHNQCIEHFHHLPKIPLFLFIARSFLILTNRASWMQVDWYTSRQHICNQGTGFGNASWIYLFYWESNFLKKGISRYLFKSTWSELIGCVLGQDAGSIFWEFAWKCIEFID